MTKILIVDDYFSFETYFNLTKSIEEYKINNIINQKILENSIIEEIKSINKYNRTIAKYDSSRLHQTHKLNQSISIQKKIIPYRTTHK